MLRHAAPKELAAFDLPDGMKVAGTRNVSTVPAHSLFLLNSVFVVAQSNLLAKQLLELPIDDESRVGALFSSILQRAESDGERIQAMSLLSETDRIVQNEVTEPDARRLRVWASLCQALFATNEFRYID